MKITINKQQKELKISDLAPLEVFKFRDTDGHIKDDLFLSLDQNSGIINNFTSQIPRMYQNGVVALRLKPNPGYICVFNSTQTVFKLESELIIQ